MFDSKRFSAIGVVFLLIITIIFTASVTYIGVRVWDKYQPTYEISFDPGKVNAENVEKFNQVKELLEGTFYKDVNQNDLLEGAVAGMANSLNDPYTVYFTKEQMARFNEKSEGSYVGIGISVNVDDQGLLTVVEPFEGSPAKKAGLLKGDKIIRVDGTDVSNIKDADMIISMIKGPEKKEVTITVYRPSDGVPIDFNMVRKKIRTQNINSEVLDANIGYIRIVMFDNTIAEDFEKTLSALVKKKIQGLVIDVRDNPGGSYEEVVKICDRLLPKSLIVYTQDKFGTKNEEFSEPGELKLPIVLLTNGNSASASEILAGAIKDNNKGELVGTTTFGKGLVQMVRPLDDGSGIKVTIARYFTPSGICIHGLGIKPDYEVQNDKKYDGYPASQIPREDDLQLKKALEVIKN